MKIGRTNKGYFKKLFASKRRLKKRVLLHERKVAQAVAQLLGIPNFRVVENRMLNSDLEWLLTWKLKTGCCPEMMWCDGLEKLQFKITGKNSIAFKSNIWVGPEDGSGEISKGIIHGEIMIKSTGKKLKRYFMEINHENSTYFVKKT